MAHPAYMTLVDKSRSACVAAVETYNRASAPYREENFAIIMINAWELLLKARVIKENNGRVASIYTMEPIRLKNGTHGTRLVKKLTKFKTPHTISIMAAMALVMGYPKNGLDATAAANIMALLDIRDHATHFMATGGIFKKTLAELSLAAVKNYVIASQDWFGVSYADLNLAAIPISFMLNQPQMEAVAKSSSSEVAKFLAHLKTEEAKLAGGSTGYAFSVVANVSLTKKTTSGAVKALLVGPKDNPDVTVAYEANKVPDGFTWDYADLCERLVDRYRNFKQNKNYHKIRKILEINPKFCHERYLDPDNTKTKKRFYNPNIVVEFDKYYTKK